MRARLTSGHIGERKVVELVQSSDSLCALPSDAKTAFLPSTMSRQPLRVPRPPQPKIAHRKPTDFSRMTYEELVRLADQQRMLIAANRNEIESRTSLGCRTEDNAARLSALRNEIMREEREMSQLAALQRETEAVRMRRQSAEQRLTYLQHHQSSQDEQLRNASSKVASLQAQLDLLHRRRIAAINAAAAQQKQLDSVGSSLKILSSPVECVNIPSDSVRNDRIIRPRASVEPIRINSLKKDDRDNSRSSSSRLPSCTHYSSPPTSIDSTDRVTHRLPMVMVSAMREESPSPPKDPHPTVSLMVPSDNCASCDIKENKMDTISTTQKSSDSPLYNKSNKANAVWHEKDIVAAMKSSPTGDDHHDGGTRLNEGEIDLRNTAADQISIRADSLRATKRRSWAQAETSVDESEFIRKLLCEEQKKGRKHLVIDTQIENRLNGYIANISVGQTKEVEDPSTADESSSVENTEEQPSVSVGEGDSEKHEESSLESSTKCETTISALRIEDEGPAEGVENSEIHISIDEETMKLIRPAPNKGILRAAGLKKPRKNIVFDPLALLLDGALEGEMDVVEESSSKISDISASNDEGITALHNAICAGHFEIVRFLVDRGADVNARDSDGWTPLHCAASCNNLPMIKLLVENGACVFSQTLSDLEIPAEKCEEDQEGYEGCRQYLEAADEAAGKINDRKMYAICAYNAERDDEMSFKKGSVLTVINRQTGENAWWICESDDGTHKGYVPRTFLSLYPCVGYTDGFTPFEVPIGKYASKQETNNNITKSASDQDLDSSSIPQVLSL
ncbi:hypothetical protein AB6A40_002484 [Gnathostoma spinigerum]|uniref:SH3 domain-containing protein n=1 Tax=Gnathostoma spinigerum TaxID=75299 RepID=A0ABD6E7W4_9BILA